MSDKDSAQNVIDSYRKRQNLAQKAPVLFGVAAALLVVGAGIIIFWLANPETPPIGFLATDTSTPTNTATVTSSPTVTNTPTETPTPQPSDTPVLEATATASGPFVYVVEQDDTLFGIAEKFGVDMLTLIALNPSIDPVNPVIRVNQELIIPAADTHLPTPTGIPEDWQGVVQYQVAIGDTLEAIATRFFSTVDEILKENADTLENPNDIFVGQILKIPVNIATPVPTPTPGLATRFPLTQTVTQTP